MYTDAVPDAVIPAINLCLVSLLRVSIAPGATTVPAIGAVAEVGNTAVGADVAPDTRKTAAEPALYTLTALLLTSVSSNVTAELLVVADKVYVGILRFIAVI